MLGVGDTTIHILKEQNDHGEVMEEAFQYKKELNRIWSPSETNTLCGSQINGHWDIGQF